MSESLYTFRTSRLRRRCDADTWRCRKVIYPGENYMRVALPPGSDLGNQRWWTMTVCTSCMNSEDSEALDEWRSTNTPKTETTPSTRTIRSTHRPTKS